MIVKYLILALYKTRAVFLNLSKGDVMTNDTVLLGGLGVLVLGVIWFVAQRLVDSNLSARAKRLSVYLIIAGFVVSVVMVMRWHAESYIAESQAVSKINTFQHSELSISV